MSWIITTQSEKAPLQSIQYDMTLSQFEKHCQTMRELHNQPYEPCMWPGGPPKKPILEMFRQDG